MVWDAAAKMDGVSLNDMLLKGPDQLASLLRVIFRFRQYRIAVSADIKEMFHQIRICAKDQSAQKFLWREKPYSKPDVYVMNVMTFGATCSPSSAQFIKNVNAQRYQSSHPRAVQGIIENHYVDDFLDSVNTEKEALLILANDVKMIHQHGGFEIRNWNSNSQKIINAMGGKTIQANKILSPHQENGMDKVLGMWWNTATDCFTFTLIHNKSNRDILEGIRRPNKREVLRILMTVYDPIGFLAHFLVYLKILLHKIWRTGMNWDDKLTDDLNEYWLTWIKVLPSVQNVQVPRCHIIDNTKSVDIQLHVFGDASEDVMAAIAYFRIEVDVNVKVSFVAAKTRIAPLKFMSIPQMELQAATLGSRLAKCIKQHHTISISNCYFWTDSYTVIAWINSDHRKYKQFVAHRISEILESTNMGQWRWLSTKLNVADEATKWQRSPQLQSDSRWYTGPEFLKLHTNDWPVRNERNTTNEELRSHLYHEVLLLHHTILPFSQLIDIERFSKWNRLLHCVAYLFRYSDNLKASCKKLAKTVGHLTQNELKRSEKFLLTLAQKEAYPNEWAVVSHNAINNVKRSVDKDSPLYRESPYLDDGIMRSSTRIDAAGYAPFDMKRPILLPRGHLVTHLIIKHYHNLYHHQSNETVVNEIRQKFVIPRLRVELKKEISACQKCKIERSRPNPPQMASLPAARLAAFSRPFTYTGLDYFGPISVSIGRRCEKRWGVLLTCLTTRAIYIELAHTLSADSCILAIRNFMARRGAPREFYSENGTNIRGAEQELRVAMLEVKQSAIAAEFESDVLKWNFNPPACPHMGGSWERNVAMLMEVENTLNSRPLTYVPISSEEEEAITPNHFLVGSSSGLKPIGVFKDETLLLKKNFMISQQYANHFWRRWVREYLPTLTRRTKWLQSAKPLGVGDIVIIVDEKLPRNCWPKGKVVSVTQAKDGQVRRAKVKTSSGIYERPAVKLALLDVEPVSEEAPLKVID